MKLTRACLAALCHLLLLECSTVNATWWLLGMQSSIDLQMTSNTYQNTCQKLHYLVARQRELCGLDRNILQSVGRGAKTGIEECQWQFRGYRWNCSTFNNNTSVFGGVVAVKSRERAYIHAVSAAGVAYSITRACSRGEIAECGCDQRILTRRAKRWEWGGCSEDVDFGRMFSKEFVDSNEERNSAEGQMNLHNNEAGRRIIKKSLVRLCKCHGVSGSCNMQVCWRKMAPFREIGDKLRKKFDSATMMRTVRRRRRLRLKPKYPRQKRPTRRDLVYLEDSPNYCDRNDKFGIAGTRGRECNRTSWGMDGCKLLCCGRGFRTEVLELSEKCNCRFVYCCHVQCEQCNRTVERHTCN
ncbi:protein Wnt-4-like [Pollicipes pollicipes]|uniref:protein Wnt-4-like n=1 Tax=Pollicipes pollicipes TaxID=41117 RepID=UPI0018850C8D|nr:protein Wnt-4-like [Pollicipes pollicipes]